MFYVTYLIRDSTAQCVYFPGAGFNPPEFLSTCGLPVSCCLATSVVRLRNSKPLVAPLRFYVCICIDSAGPAWSSLNQDLYGSGRLESGIWGALQAEVLYPPRSTLSTPECIRNFLKNTLSPFFLDICPCQKKSQDSSWLRVAPSRNFPRTWTWA